MVSSARARAKLASLRRAASGGGAEHVSAGKQAEDELAQPKFIATKGVAFDVNEYYATMVRLQPETVAGLECSLP
jgi:hypothetical protein